MEENILEVEKEESEKAKQLENVQTVNERGQLAEQLVQELQQQALQDGMESADASARQSQIEKEEEESGDESESGSEVSYSGDSSSESDSEASQRDGKSPSPEEQLLKETLSEALPHHVIPTLVGAALDDGMISAQRSAAESRAESTRPTLVENEQSRESSRRTSVSSDSSNASDASTVISVEDSFTPPKDPAGYRSSWTTAGQLKCVFELTLPNRFTEVEIEDDLLEQALANHDESLSPVFSLQKPETDYSLLIPFELLYRSNTRHIRARGSRDGIHWIDLPADGRFIDGFEENFAKIATRRCKYVTLVYGILRDKLEVSSHGGMVKSKADSRIYFQEFGQKYVVSKTPADSFLLI